MTPLVGSMLPRLYTPPLVLGRGRKCPCGCALGPATSFGFSLVEFAEEVVGVTLLPWQKWLSIHAFETIERNGKRVFRYRTILILIARQNGKTTWVELKNLWKMFVRQVPLIIGTAQNVALAEESWMHAIEIVEGIEDLNDMVAKVDNSNGKKALILTNGSRWKIAAATRGGGRGLSGDDINLDELREHRDWLAWGAVTKTTIARPEAQVFAFTNAGDDKSVVLNELQENARGLAKALGELLATKPTDVIAALEREQIDETFGLFEWSVPDDVKCTCRRTGAHPHKPICQLADRELWAMANPSLGHTITERALASALSTDPEAVFRTECLCQRVPDLNKAVIDPVTWASLHDPNSRPNIGEISFAVDVSPSGDYASIASYSVRQTADGPIGHVEAIDHREGTSWIPERLAVLKERYNPVAITLDSRSPAGQLLVDLEKYGIRKQALVEVDDPDEVGGKREEWARGGLYIPSSQEVAAGCGQFTEAVKQGTFRHTDQAPLTVAIAGAKARPLGDAWAWGRRLAEVDISPLVACTLARYAHVKLSPKLAIEQDYDVLASVL